MPFTSIANLAHSGEAYLPTSHVNNSTAAQDHHTAVFPKVSPIMNYLSRTPIIHNPDDLFRSPLTTGRKYPSPICFAPLFLSRKDAILSSLNWLHIVMNVSGLLGKYVLYVMSSVNPTSTENVSPTTREYSL